MMGRHLVFVPLQLGADQVVDAHLATGVNDPSFPVANAHMGDFALWVGKEGHVISTDLIQGDFISTVKLL